MFSNLLTASSQFPVASATVWLDYTTPADVFEINRYGKFRNPDLIPSTEHGAVGDGTGLILSVTGSNTVERSEDYGITSSNITITGSTSLGPIALSPDGTVIVGEDDVSSGKIFKSDDSGATFNSTAKTNFGQPVRSIATDGNGNWVAVSFKSISQGGTSIGVVRYSSDDGDTWSSNIPIGMNVQTVSYSNGYWMAFGDHIWRSSDMSTWSNVKSNASMRCGVGNGAGKWVAVQDSITNYYTSDDNGSNWTERTFSGQGNNTNRTGPLKGIFCDGSVWFLFCTDPAPVSSKDKYAISTNGTTFSFYDFLDNANLENACVVSAAMDKFIF